MSSPPQPVESAAVLFAELERRHRYFVWPAIAVFIGGYLTTMVVVAYLPQAMSVVVAGHLRVGYLLVLGNFAVTFIVAIVYRWYAGRRLDPLAQQVREAMTEQPVEAAL